MAVFHFEIKSDRRKGGKQTSALQHVKYINREGPYQDADERELIKMPTENVHSASSSKTIPVSGYRATLPRKPLPLR